MRPCRARRASEGTRPYATSWVSACLKVCSTSGNTRVSRRNSAACRRCRSSASASSARPVTARSKGKGTIRPITAATSRSCRRGSSRRWVRARMTSSTVSGTARSRRPARAIPWPARGTAPISCSERTSSSMKKGLPSALSTTSLWSAGGSSSTPRRLRAIRRLSSPDSVDERERRVEAPPPRAGRYPGRCVMTTSARLAAIRSASRAIQSSVAGSHQCRSSSTTTCGRSSAPRSSSEMGGPDDRRVPPPGIHGEHRGVPGIDRQQVAQERERRRHVCAEARHRPARSSPRPRPPGPRRRCGPPGAACR